jgi:hypothetical protein
MATFVISAIGYFTPRDIGVRKFPELSHQNYSKEGLLSEQRQPQELSEIFRQDKKTIFGLVFPDLDQKPIRQYIRA